MKRAFIIGNGPSLSDTPLDLLIGETCFATNEIRLVYDRVKWRATHFICSLEEWDLNIPLLYNWWWHNFVTHIEMPTKVYVNRGHNGRVAPLMWRKHEGAEVVPIAACGHFQNNFDEPEAPKEWHEGLCSYGSTLHIAIQLAEKEYSPLHLVGCDLGYEDGGENHMVDGYVGDRVDYLRPAKYSNGNCIAAHEAAKRSSKVPIYNATIGGELEVYERVDFMEVINA